MGCGGSKTSTARQRAEHRLYADPRLAAGEALRREMTTLLITVDADDDPDPGAILELQLLLAEQESLRIQLRELHAREATHFEQERPATPELGRAAGLIEREATAVRGFRSRELDTGKLYTDVCGVATNEIKALMREELMLRRHTEILRWLLDHEPSTLPRHLRDTLEPGWLQGVIEGLAWAGYRANTLASWQDEWWQFVGFSESRRHLERRVSDDARIHRASRSKLAAMYPTATNTATATVVEEDDAAGGRARGGDWGDAHSADASLDSDSDDEEVDWMDRALGDRPASGQRASADLPRDPPHNCDAVVNDASAAIADGQRFFGRLGSQEPEVEVDPGPNDGGDAPSTRDEGVGQSKLAAKMDKVTLADLEAAGLPDEAVWYRWWANGDTARRETMGCRRRALRQDWQFWRVIVNVHAHHPGAAADSSRFANVARKEEIRVMFDSEPIEEYRTGTTTEPATDPTAVTLVRLGLCRELTVGDGEICAVCCADYEPGEHTFRLPCCHKFHIQCVKPWLLGDHAGQGKCPLCNRHVLEDPPDFTPDVPTAVSSAAIAHSDRASVLDSSTCAEADRWRAMTCYGTRGNQEWMPLWRSYELIYKDFKAEFVPT